MSKKTLLLGAIASIITINSVFADTTVTTKDYVDSQVATKQTKIDVTDANFTNGSIVTYTDTAGTLGLRGVWDDGAETAYNGYNTVIDNYPEYADATKGMVPTMNGLTGIMKWMMPANGSGYVIKNRPSGAGAQVHYLPEFADTSGRWYRIRTVNSVDESIGGWQRYNVIPTLAALDSGLEAKQDKMTCAQYITGAEETSENCLLWNVPD